MLNDSWDIVSAADASESMPRLPTTRRVLHDLFSLALCIGGIIMMWVSNIDVISRAVDKEEAKRQNLYVLAAIYALIAVV